MSSVWGVHFSCGVITNGRHPTPHLVNGGNVKKSGRKHCCQFKSQHQGKLCQLISRTSSKSKCDWCSMQFSTTDEPSWNWNWLECIQISQRRNFYRLNFCFCARKKDDVGWWVGRPFVSIPSYLVTPNPSTGSHQLSHLHWWSPLVIISHQISSYYEPHQPTFWDFEHLRSWLLWKSSDDCVGESSWHPHPWHQKFGHLDTSKSPLALLVSEISPKK